MRIQEALMAIQEFGFSPDNAVIYVLYTPDGDFSKRAGVKGAWFDDHILEWLEKEAESIDISMNAEEVTIKATFE